MSFDFAVSQLPGWHTTIFPPYFVAGAIFSGFAMVVTPGRPGPRIVRAEGLHHPAAPRQHGQDHPGHRLMVGYSYLMEFFIAWYSGNPWEQFTFHNRAFGPMCWAGG